MGKVATVYKVFAEDVEKSDAIRATISETLKPTGIQVEEIGFGIKVIKVMFVHEDQEGSTKYEDSLRKIDGVRDVEVDEETLL